MFLDSKRISKTRRLFRRHRRDAIELTQQADEQLERLLVRRLNRLVFVRRFIISWFSLFALLLVAVVLQIRGLDAYYQQLKPVPGGIYSEGLIGNFTNANPLYTSGGADTTVSKLIFSSLFTYDDKNKLVGDLAERYEVDAKETRYVVSLRPNITWHDGKPFTADDVVFTYKTIQNIEAKSSLYASWQGIKVSKKGDSVVIFDLPNQLSSFPYALTNGIIPSHLLKDIPANQLRSAQFNSSPVGTGPFKWRFVEQTGRDSKSREQRITLAPNTSYYKGKPKLDGFVVHTFREDSRLVDSFKQNKIIAMSGLDSAPDLGEKINIFEYTTPLTSEVMLFMNNSRDNLKDVKVRKALAVSIDKREVVRLAENPERTLDGPLMPGQLGYTPSLTLNQFNLTQANTLLDEAGWKRAAGGLRVKDGKKLTVQLRAANKLGYAAITQYVAKQWQLLGITVDPLNLSSDDLQSSVIAIHEYDVLLHGISIGVDPDVFAFWHSSQAGLTSQGKLNLSEYKSTAADQALEAGRTRSNAQLRAVKYRAFQDAWRADYPAVALYQPQYYYITRGEVYNYKRQAFNNASDRLNNVHNWMIREESQDK